MTPLKKLISMISCRDKQYVGIFLIPYTLVFFTIAFGTSTLYLNSFTKKVQAEENVATPLDTFKTYESIRKKIANKTLTKNDIELSNMISNCPEYSKLYELFDRFSRKDDFYRELYRMFILLKPNSDILYGYLQQEFEYLIIRLSKLENFEHVENGDVEKNRPSTYWLELGQTTIIAYSATKEVRFLELFATTFNKFIQFRDFELDRVDYYRKRKMKSWGCFLKNRDNKEIIFYNTVTFTGGIIFPVVKFCKVVLEDELLKEKYGKKALEYLKVVEDAVAEFMDEFLIVQEINGGYFIALDDNRNVEPLNHSHYFGATLVELYSLTRKSAYLQIAEMMSRYFLASVNEDDNGSYWWGYRPVPNNMKNHPPEPIWKGRRTIILPLTAYKYGIVFTNKDMKALTKTFTSNIYAGKNIFNMYIGGNKWKPLLRENIEEEFIERVQALAGWILLDEFEP